MRFSEFKSTLESIDHDLIATAMLAKEKAAKQDKSSIPMQAFLNMLKNSETPYSYDSLVSAYETNPNLKNIIQQFNKDEIVFSNTKTDNQSTSIVPVGDVPPEKKVNSMAKAALAKRESVEEVDLDEGKMKNTTMQANKPRFERKGQELEAYANKFGGVDKKDMMKVAAMLKRGDKSGALKYAKTLDTDPKEYILDLLGEEVELDEANPAKMSDEVLKSRLDQLQKSLDTRGDSPAIQHEIKRLNKEIKKRESVDEDDRGLDISQEPEENPVASAILYRIVRQHPNVFMKYGPEEVMIAAGDVAEMVGDVDEIGSSDISIWTRQTIDMLDGMDESVTQRNNPISRLKRLAGLGEELVGEKAPPGFDEKLEKKLLAQYKDNPGRAYATMWSIHNKKK